jgi:hypothetical protein
VVQRIPDVDRALDAEVPGFTVTDGTMEAIDDATNAECDD